MKSLIAFCLALIVLAQGSSSSRVNVRVITDEADTALAILAKRKLNQPITEADWQRVFQSEGYVRLKQRETWLKRSFEEADFKKFMLSDELAARTSALEETLARWKRTDITRVAQRALTYLPKDATIRAKVYPVIKPRDNSFVFDVNSDPAIFLYLDPTSSTEKFENTVAHELHHIGYGTSCPRKDVADAIAKLPPQQQRMLKWAGAFGEGFAMLAAAGGPDVHPHAVSSAEERARWDADMTNFNSDLRKVDAFFTEILEGKITGIEMDQRGFSFFGVQGPWYTVGWKMSVLIEKTYGREKLIECMCDQRLLFATYNRAATKHNRKTREPLALWSNAVLPSTTIKLNSFLGTSVATP
jgi:hypothetical protein